MSRSLDRALSIIELFNIRPEWGITEIAAELDLAKSTIHGLVKTLEGRDYLQPTVSGKYRLGLKAFELGRAYAANIELSTAAAPMVKWLAEKYGQTIHIAVYAGHMAVFIISNEPETGRVLYARAGTSLSAYCTASGKMLLAWQPRIHIYEYLEEEELLPLTSNTITSRSELLAELEDIRNQGYALDREELMSGIACVAAPIFGPRHRILATISVTGNADLMLGAKKEECIKDVIEAARIISMIMGSET